MGGADDADPIVILLVDQDQLATAGIQSMALQGDQAIAVVE